MPATPSRGESIKGVGDDSWCSTPRTAESVVADADPGLTITFADAVQHQLFGTIPSVTIQFHAFEVRLYVLTTVYACYAYNSYKIAHPSAIASYLEIPYSRPIASALSHACACSPAVPYSRSYSVANACSYPSSFPYTLASHAFHQVIYTSTPCSCVAKIFHTGAY
jgi:hypothetical protein